MATKTKHMEFVPFLPLLLAYLLQGGKTGATFFPVFIALGITLIYLTQSQKVRPVPMGLVVAFGGLLLWLWVPLLTNAPLVPHLFIYSRVFLYIAAGFLAFQRSSASFDEKFKTLLIFLGGVECVLIFSSFLRGISPQESGHLKNSLHSGILLPVAYAVVLSKINFAQWKSAKNWRYIILGFLLVLAVVLIRSRAGILSIGAVTLYLASGKKWWLISLGAAVLGAIGLFYGKHLLVQLEVDSLGFKMSAGRFTIWKSAVDAILAQPFFGYGLGNFEAAYKLFQHPSYTLLRYGKSTIFAHNSFLQTAVEGGLPALALVLSGLTYIFKQKQKFYRENKGLISILIVYFITALFNYSLFLPFNGLIFSIAIGILVHRGVHKKNLEWKKFRLISGVLFGLLSIFLLSYALSDYYFRRQQYEKAALMCPMNAEAHYETGLKELREGRNPISHLKNALIWNSQNSFYWQRLALVLLRQQIAQKGDFRLVNHSFKMAQALAPHHAPFFVQDGFYRLAAGDLKEAEERFERAAQLEPAAPVPLLGISKIREKEGRTIEAKEYADKAQALWDQKEELMNHPDYAPTYRHMFGSSYAKYLFRARTK